MDEVTCLDGRMGGLGWLDYDLMDGLAWWD